MVDYLQTRELATVVNRSGAAIARRKVLRHAGYSISAVLGIPARCISAVFGFLLALLLPYGFLFLPFGRLTMPDYFGSFEDSGECFHAMR